MIKLKYSVEKSILDNFLIRETAVFPNGSETFLYGNLVFNNPFDAYFWLMENVEGEIV